MSDSYFKYTNSGRFLGELVEFPAFLHLTLARSEGGRWNQQAMFVFADMHAEPLTYPVSERCEPVPNSGTWQTTGSGSTRTMYYPLWVPEISP